MDRGLPPALALLAKSKGPLSDQAMVEAVPYLRGEMLAAVVDHLIKRENNAALMQLLQCRRVVGSDLDALMLPRLNELHPVLSGALFASDTEDRLTAVALIEASNDTRCADLLVDTLRHSCPRTREAAASGLSAMIHRVLSECRTTPDQVAEFKEQTEQVAAAMRQALEGWRQHHQVALLPAALRLMPFMEQTLARAAEQQGTPLAHALQKTLEGASEPELAEAVIRCLAIPTLRPAAAQAISRASNVAFITGLLKAAWLLVGPAVRHGCLSIRKGKWEPQWLDALVCLSDSELPAAIAFVMATGASLDGKLELLRQVMAASSASARRAAFWPLVAHANEPAARHVLEGLAVREDGEFAGVAKLECARRMGSASALGLAGSTSPKGVAAPQIHLRNALHDASAVERVRALAAIESSASAAVFKDDILRLLKDASPAVRSAAVSLLPKLRVSNPAYQLRQALADGDWRVQANAIQAADLLHLGELLPVITPLLKSADSRVRANAVKFCAQEGWHEAGEVLISMLESGPPADRRSALWVADKLCLHSLEPRIERLAAADPDVLVQRMAQRIVQGLRQNLQDGRRAVALAK